MVHTGVTRQKLSFLHLLNNSKNWVSENILVIRNTVLRLDGKNQNANKKRPFSKTPVCVWRPKLLSSKTVVVGTHISQVNSPSKFYKLRSFLGDMGEKNMDKTFAFAQEMFVFSHKTFAFSQEIFWVLFETKAKSQSTSRSLLHVCRLGNQSYGEVHRFVRWHWPQIWRNEVSAWFSAWFSNNW